MILHILHNFFSYKSIYSYLMKRNYLLSWKISLSLLLLSINFRLQINIHRLKISIIHVDRKINHCASLFIIVSSIFINSIYRTTLSIMVEFDIKIYTRVMSTFIFSRSHSIPHGYELKQVESKNETIVTKLQLNQRIERNAPRYRAFYYRAIVRTSLSLFFF